MASLWGFNLIARKLFTLVSKSDIDAAFASPEGLIDETVESLYAFANGLSDFVSKNKPTAFIENETKTGCQIHKVRYPTIPSLYQRKAYSVVTHARHALDQAVYAGTVCLDGDTHRTNTYFPFSRDPDDFDSLFVRRGRCKHVAPRLIPTLKGMEPWPTGPSHSGGNDFLRAFGKISGPNKHRVMLGPKPNIKGLNFNIAIKGVKNPRIPPKHIAGTNDFELFTTIPGAEYKYEIDLFFEIGLDEVFPGPETRAVDVLAKIGDVSKKIVAAIKDFVVSEIT